MSDSRNVTHPPFTVAITVDAPAHGVYCFTPIATGHVIVAGRAIEVSLGLDEPVVPPGTERPAAAPGALAIKFDDRALRIDLTDMLEAIVAQAMTPGIRLDE